MPHNVGMIAGALLLAFAGAQAASAGAPDAAAGGPAALSAVRQMAAEGRLDQAKRALEAMDASAPGVSHLRGVVDFRLRQYPQAAGELLSAVRDEKEGSEPWRESVLMLGESLYLAARAADAIPWLEKARSVAGKGIEPDYMLGNCYIQNRQPEKAVGAFARMIGVPPDSAAAHLIAAKMMIRSEFEDAAAAELHRALELNPKIPEAHYMLGEMDTFHGHFDQAITELQQEIAVNPGFAMAWYKLGDAYTRREQWDLAAPQLEKAVWLEPTYSGPYILLGKTYFKQNRFAEAENILRKSLQLDPRNASAHYILGQVLMREGRAAEGKKMLEESEALRDSEHG